MTYRTNIDSQLRGFYFAASGNDDFDGETLERPKKSIQAAIDAAEQLSPPPSNTATGQVTAAQGGSFNDSFVMIDSVSIEALGVSLVNGDPTTIVMASSVGCDVSAVVNLATAGTCVLIDSKSLSGFSSKFIGVIGANSICVDITGEVEDLFIDLSRVRITGVEGVGLNVTSTMLSPANFTVNTVGLLAADSTFVNYDPVTPESVSLLDVASVTNKAGGETFLGAMGFLCKAGQLIVSVGRVVSQTIVEASGSSQFSLKGNALVGDTIAKDTAVINYKSVGFLNGAIDIQDTATFLGDVSFIIGDLTVAVGAHSDLFASTMIGDIVIDGSADILILSHTGTVTNNGTINGIINGVPYGTWRQKHEEMPVLNASSFIDQNPAGFAPLQLTFGAAQFGASDPIQIDTSGNITANQADQYNLDLVLQYGRTGAGGVAFLFFRVLINGVQFGDSRYAKLDGVNDDLPVQLSTPVNLNVNDIITVQIIRDAAGNNSGGVITRISSAGWSQAPSASISLTRNRLVQPV